MYIVLKIYERIICIIHILEKCNTYHFQLQAKLLQHQRKKHSSLMEPADQIPRPRSRPPQNQNQPPPSLSSSSSVCTNSTGAHNQSIKIESSEASHHEQQQMAADFAKPRLIRLNSTNTESLSSSSSSNSSSNNNGFDLLNPQFARVRDMR